ncbi:Flagellum site-determining protein YlxH [uncultured bacterium]|nr:Flagellum site-determining protein YlxH [uncultured bacterium]
MFNLNWIRKLIFWERDYGAQLAPAPMALRPVRATSPYGTSIWSVGGGKGGVGKSLVASNLALSLSKQGKKVLLVDADLGAANLHTFLGVEGGKGALSSFLKDEISDIGSLISKTPFPNLDLISGAKDSLDVADVRNAQVTRLREALKKVEYDYAVLDIGPGTSSNLLDMFLMGNEGIILSTPEPTTIENNYRFLKCLFLRKIKSIADSQEDGLLNGMLQKIFSDKWSQRVKTVADIVEQISMLDFDQGRMLKEDLAATSISMIMNQTKRNEDAEMGDSIRKACTDYFGMDIGYLGSVGYEETVSESVRLRRPLVMHYSASRAARSIEGCLEKLMNRANKTQPVTIQF